MKLQDWAMKERIRLTAEDMAEEIAEASGDVGQNALQSIIHKAAVQEALLDNLYMSVNNLQNHTAQAMNTMAGIVFRQDQRVTAIAEYMGNFSFLFKKNGID